MKKVYIESTDKQPLHNECQHIKNKTLLLFVTSIAVLCGFSLESATLLFAGFALMSPLIPFLFTWFFVKPSRLMALSNSKVIITLRTLALAAVLYGMFTIESATLYENFFSKDAMVLESVYQAPVFVMATTFFLTPILFAITLLELCGSVFLLMLYMREKDMRVFHQHVRVDGGTAMVFTSLLALVGFTTFFILLYLGG